MRRTLQLLILTMIATACAGTSSNSPTPTTPSTAPSPSVTTTTSTTSTTMAATTTIPPTTTTLGPVSEADFDELYRELDAIRETAYVDADLELVSNSVTEWSETFGQVDSLVAGGHHARPRQTGEYVIDRVELYDRPTEDLALLLVTDTATSPFVVVDGQDEEVSSTERHTPSLQFLVTMVATADGWRIGADIPIIDPDTGSPELLNLDPPDETTDLPVDTRNISVRTWSDGSALCAEMRTLTPEIGRVVSCEPWAAPIDNFTSYAFPLLATDGTAHTAFRIDSPGGQVYQVRIDTDLGEAVTFRTVTSEAPPYRVGFALFEGDADRVRLYSETGETLFDTNA